MQKKLLPSATSYNPVEAGKAAAQKIENNFKILLESAKNPLQEKIYSANPLFAANTRDISVPIFKACAGIEKMRIVASGVNNGAISNMPLNAAVEYTMDIDGMKITPVENQFVPAPFADMVSALSEFQTLLGEAIVKHDHRIFAAALETYLFCNRQVVGKLFGLFKDIINSEMQKASAFFD
jgi:alpha-galactosidase/6-phospho-beta-glucosidase family protein